jgi:hypothetical protein
VLGEYDGQRRSARAAELIEAGFARLSGEPAPNAAMIIPPPAPLKTRHVADTSVSEPHPFMPVALRKMAVAPGDPLPPADIGREVRTRTCRGYSGFSKPEPEHDHDAGDTSVPAATSSIAKPSSTAPAVTQARAAVIVL